MIRAVLAAALLTTAPVLAFADEARPVFLKERLVAQGPVITLGDLFADAGAAADVALARSPAPGERLSLDPAHVRTVAAQQGLDWSNAGGMLRITVERSARTVSSSELTAMVEEMLFVETGAPHAVTLSNTRASLNAPVGALGEPELISFDHDARSGLFRAELRAWPGGAVETISGRAEAVMDLPVLTRPVARGAVIAASDIDWIRMPASQVRAEHLTTLDALVGMAARRALRPDQPVRGYDIEAPAIITRGEIVSLVFTSGALTLAARARAMEDAAQGEVIRFVNLQSNRTVEAVAEGPGRARVGGPAYTN